jgi:hypothetical protein
MNKLFLYAMNDTTPIIALSLASLEVIQPLAAAFVKITTNQSDSKANKRF